MFWEQTPYELRLSIDAFQQKNESQHKGDLWKMWHSAALYRCKKFPDIKTFIVGKQKTVKGIDEAAIIAGLKAYSKRYKQERPNG